MKKLLALILCLGLVFSVAATADAAQEECFVLCAVTANAVIIEPVQIPYTPGQTVKEALLASDHQFVGLEQGFIYEIDGVSANFSIFYDGNGYNLDVDAADIRALCIGVNSQYSQELLDLLVAMGEYRQMGNVQQYPEAREAYRAGLTAIRNGDAATAKAALDRLNAAIEAYNAIVNGTKYTVTIAATQGDTQLAAPTVTFTDGYGNVTTVSGSAIRVVAGEYTFCVSDGGFNRTEGTLTVEGDTALSVVLPHGEWFGATKILNGQAEPFPYTQDTAAHTAVFQIPDVAKELSSLYLNIEQGAVPDRNTTRLRTIYTGVNGTDYSQVARSWESVATALSYLVSPGMTDASFRLEAQYTDSNGHVQIQSYAMTLERVPTLAGLTVSAEGTVLPLDFDPVTYRYDLATVSDSLDISAQPFDGTYEISGAGSTAFADSHTVRVSCNGRTTDYVLNMTKRESVNVTLSVPDGVHVQVENAAHSVIAPVDGVYRLIPGESYTYRATKNQHYHTEYTFTASDGLALTVAEPVAEDWLTDLALYNGSNVNTRQQYAGDTPFAAADHSYVYTVSDCNTTVYAQATSAYTVTARYMTQTTSAATHGNSKNITVSKTVSETGSATVLMQAVCKSGYHNTVTLRVSRVSNNVTYYQDYTLTLAKQLHLTQLSVSDRDEELILLDSTGSAVSFDRDNTQYRLKVNREETAIYLTGELPNILDATSCCGGYWVTINGLRQEALEQTAVSLDPGQNEETVHVEVHHADDAALVTCYTLTVQKTDPVAITFALNPAEAIVYMTNDLNGKRVLPEGNVYALTPGVTYSYTVNCTGYLGIQGSYTAPETDETVTINMTPAPANPELEQLESFWPHLRQNNENNGVINAPTPITDREAVLYWATKIGTGYDKNACGCPILVDGYLYTYSGDLIYKVDTVSGEILATGRMDHASSFAINPPTYADGMLFIGLADGTVQAFNAANLESLWIYRDPLAGQPNCSIIYHEGYVYTGFWVGETNEANYVCISATDEDPTQPKEEKLATWKYTSLGGFYWAGAYVCDDYLLIGTDDGKAGYTSGHARLLCFDPATGVLLDQYTLDVPGDIRSSITAYNGKYYFTNKGGYFFEASVSGSGDITAVTKLKLSNYASNDATPPMSTCTPTIYNGRAYVGVSGTNQFGAYSGHNITVIDIPNWEIAYSVRTQGYPQTSGILTTAYTAETGCVYVYFFDNYTPGKLRILEDRPGQTEASMVLTESFTDKGTTTTYETAFPLFTPDGNQAQYAICSPIVDESGTIYFKNDSAYLMAVGSTIDRLEITQVPQKLSYKEGEVFDAAGMQVTAYYANGLSRDVTEYVTWSEEPLTAQDTDFMIQLPHVMYQNQDGTAGVSYPAPFAAVQLTIERALLPGDVNDDGTVEEGDVTLLMQYINGTAELTQRGLSAADVSPDGVIDMKDTSLLLQYIQGVITEFPPKPEE